MQQNDSSGVERTNDDATLCKRSAVQYGYWEDPYLSAFISRSIKFAFRLLRFLVSTTQIMAKDLSVCFGTMSYASYFQVASKD